MQGWWSRADGASPPEKAPRTVVGPLRLSPFAGSPCTLFTSRDSSRIGLPSGSGLATRFNRKVESVTRLSSSQFQDFSLRPHARRRKNWAPVNRTGSGSPPAAAKSHAAWGPVSVLHRSIFLPRGCRTLKLRRTRAQPHRNQSNQPRNRHPASSPQSANLSSATPARSSALPLNTLLRRVPHSSSGLLRDGWEVS